jgi:hypothetical protein
MVIARASAFALVVVTVLGACSLSMPDLPGLASYYEVTDPASGTVYYADDLSREKRGVIEFRDGKTGAWVSIPGATVREISKRQFRAGTRR